MKIDAHNPEATLAALYKLGLHENTQHTQSHAAQLQHDDEASGTTTDSSSSIKAVEASGSAREDQALRKESEYSQKEKQVIDQMKARDREVRAHEAAHKSAAGSLAQGAATFSYDTGPDGHQYAVAGEVKIDTSKVDGNPEATIVKAQIIRRAAMAPAQPSSQDRNVAAMATQMEAEARQELQLQKQEELEATQPGQASQEKTAQSRQKASQLEAAVTSIIPTPVGELLNASV